VGAEIAVFMLHGGMGKQVFFMHEFSNVLFIIIRETKVKMAFYQNFQCCFWCFPSKKSTFYGEKGILLPY